MRYPQVRITPTPTSQRQQRQKHKTYSQPLKQHQTSVTTPTGLTCTTESNTFITATSMNCFFSPGSKPASRSRPSSLARAGCPPSRLARRYTPRVIAASFCRGPWPFAASKGQAERVTGASHHARPGRLLARSSFSSSRLRGYWETTSRFSRIAAAATHRAQHHHALSLR